MTTFHFAEWKTRVQWELSRLWARTGVPELLALSLLTLWLGLHMQVNAPLQSEVNVLAKQTRLLQEKQLALKQSGKLGHPVSNSSQDFLTFLPSEKELESQLLKLHKLAKQNNLAVGRADYRAEPVTALAVSRWSLRLSLQGSYVAQRQFLHAVLEALPNLAVERLTLEKTAGMGDNVTTQMEANLYYRVPAGQPL